MKLLLDENNETQSWILDYYKSKTKLNYYIIEQAYAIKDTNDKYIFKLDIKHPDENVKNYRKHMTLEINKSDLQKTLRDYKLNKIFE
jgi:hypothetical protein